MDCPVNVENVVKTTFRKLGVNIRDVEVYDSADLVFATGAAIVDYDTAIQAITKAHNYIYSYLMQAGLDAFDDSTSPKVKIPTADVVSANSDVISMTKVGYFADTTGSTNAAIDSLIAATEVNGIVTLTVHIYCYPNPDEEEY